MNKTIKIQHTVMLAGPTGAMRCTAMLACDAHTAARFSPGHTIDVGKLRLRVQHLAHPYFAQDSPVWLTQDYQCSTADEYQARKSALFDAGFAIQDPPPIITG